MLCAQPMYYRNAQAAVVVYDVTKASSLEKAKTWVKELQRQAKELKRAPKPVKILLLGELPTSQWILIHKLLRALMIVVSTRRPKRVW